LTNSQPIGSWLKQQLGVGSYRVNTYERPKSPPEPVFDPVLPVLPPKELPPDEPEVPDVPLPNEPLFDPPL